VFFRTAHKITRASGQEVAIVGQETEK